MNKRERLVIDNFKGLSTTKASNRISLQNSPEMNGMFVTPKNALTPIPLITNDATPFSSVSNLIPVQFSSNVKYLVATDGTDFKYTTGNGTYSYLGYTTGTVTRSGTTLTGTGTAWDTNIAAGDQFKYDADSTWLNIASVDSTTQITLSSSAGATSGAYMIRKVMNNSVRPKGVVLNDLLILCDGVRIADKWDGLSLQKISGMPILRGLELHKRHIFGFDKDKIYWCDINTPTTWTGTNLESIATKDGGEIVAIKSYAEALHIFKSNGKVYVFIGEAPFIQTTPTYSVTQISTPSNFGVLAPETISIHNNLLRFQTTVGTWDFDGVGFELVTRDINPTVADVQIPNVLGSSVFIDNTAAEFAAGTLSDTEYDTSNSRLQLEQDKLLDNFTDGDYTADPVWTVGAGSWSVSSNKLQSASDTSLSFISTPSTNAYGSWSAKITPNPLGTTYRWAFISSATNFGGSYYSIDIDATGGVRLTRSGTTILFVASAVVGGTEYTFAVTRSSGGVFELFINGVSKGTVTDTNLTSSSYMVVGKTASFVNCRIIIDDIYKSAITGTFVSQIFDGTTGLIRWDSITVNAALNGESYTLEYRAEASSPPSGAWTAITSGQSIGSANRYLQYRLTLTSSALVGISPHVTAVTVNYSISKDSVNKPIAISFKDRWHLGYCTGGSTNTDTLIQDEAGEWVKWDNEFSCAAIFNNQLYIGYPTGSVQIWYVGTTSVVSNRSWKSPQIDFGFPEYLKFIDRIVLVHKFTSATCAVGYSINEGSFTSSDISLASSGSTDIPVRTVLVDQSCNKFQVQLSFPYPRDTEDFEIYAVIIYWNLLELR